MQDPNGVNPAEVKEFLEASSPPPNTIPLDLPPGLAEGMAALSGVTGDWGSKKGSPVEQAEPENRQELPDDSQFRPDLPGADKNMIWHRDSFDVEVKVTDMDKAVFLKSALHDDDDPLVFDIVLEGFDYPVKVRNLSNYEREVINTALHRDSDEKSTSRRVINATQLLTYCQYYSAYLMIASHNNKARAYPRYETGKYENLDKDVEDLRLNGLNWGLQVPGPLWALLFWACYVFDVKYRICTEALLNRNFWKPEGGG